MVLPVHWQMQTAQPNEDPSKDLEEVTSGRCQLGKWLLESLVFSHFLFSIGPIYRSPGSFVSMWWNSERPFQVKSSPNYPNAFVVYASKLSSSSTQFCLHPLVFHKHGLWDPRIKMYSSKVCFSCLADLIHHLYLRTCFPCCFNATRLCTLHNATLDQGSLFTT